MTTYERHNAEMEYLKSAKKTRDKVNNEILSEATDIDDLFRKASIAYKRFHIDRDTRMAAARYADIDSETSMKVNDFALENDKHQMRLVEENMKAANKLNQTMFEKGWSQVMGPDGQPMWAPLPWAEGGTGYGNIEGQNVGTDYGGAENGTSAGDGTSTGVFSQGEDTDYVMENWNTSNKKLD
jgi:hypothetical protein